MIDTLFVVSLMVSVAISLRLRSPQLPEERQALLRGLREFTVPLAVTSGLFAALQWWVRRAMDGVTAVTSIRELEERIRMVRNTWVEKLVVPPWVQLIVIAVLVLLGILWPNLRRVTLLDDFKTGARWMTRVQIVATLLASFTFFGSVHATTARAATARLGEDIEQIRRLYTDAFAAADEAIAIDAAAVLLSDPAWSPALGDLAGAITAEEQAHREWYAARASVARQPHAELRDFRVTADEKTRPAERVAFLPRQREDIAPRNHWTHEEGKRLAAEAEAVRRQAVTEFVNAAADVGRDALAKQIVAEFFAGSVAEGLALVVLDASVFYDFRHVIARATANVVERVVRHGDSLRAAVARVRPAVRHEAARLAPAAAEVARAEYGRRAETAGTNLAAAQEGRRTTLDEYRERAAEQAARETRALLSRIAAKDLGGLQRQAAAVAERYVKRGDVPAMTRISRARELATTLDSDFRLLDTLLASEKTMGQRELQHALEMQVDRIMLGRRYATHAGVFESRNTFEEWIEFRTELKASEEARPLAVPPVRTPPKSERSIPRPVPKRPRPVVRPR